MENLKNEYPLAIICPVVNCVNYTKQFIKSIKTNLKYKLIIIDNGSNDGTLAYLLSIKDKYPLRIIKSSYNMGVGPAWNYGINLAIKEYNSQYFFIPNNDIILQPKTIDTLIDTIKNPKTVLVTALNINNGTNSLADLKTTSPPKNSVYSENPDFSCFMIKMETIDKIGLFDEKFYPAYFEDNDYHFRIKMAGLKAIKTNQALYYHFGSMSVKNNQETRDLSNGFYLQNKEYFNKKWGGYPGQETFTTPFNK
jgi:GT2 family glycosyltransferase